MNPNFVKHLVTFGLCGIVALFAGYVLADASIAGLILLTYGCLAIFVLVSPGFAPLIAIGLFSPFVLPLPYILSVPFLLLILAICCLKLFLYRALSRRNLRAMVHCFTVPFILFFGWVAMRYLMKPAIPNMAGFGENVSGFRAYLNYGLCFSLVFLLPYMISRREDLFKLPFWMGVISVFFILLMTPLVFSRSVLAAQLLEMFGLFVTFFDNGMLRFVALPGFGIILLALVFLPHLAPLSKTIRIVLGGLGCIAVLLGGSRSGLVAAIVTVLAIVWLRRRFLMFGLMVASVAAGLLAFHYIGETISSSREVGLLRVFSLVSSRLTYQSNAEGTIEWREVRWRRAVEEIKRDPLFGKGYGGLENAWIFGGQAENARMEIDLASGGIHNGYLASAYSLGIPALLLFVIGFARQIIRSAKQAQQQRELDPRMSELNIFVCANLLGLVFSIYIGADLNTPVIWFYLGWGVLLDRTCQAQAKESPAAQPELATPELAPSHSMG